MKNWRVVVWFGIGFGIMGGCASSGGESLAGEPAAVQSASDGQPESALEKPTEEPLANTLKWTTASEVDNFGFDIYRGLSEDGQFVKITTEPLAGAGTTDEPQKYVFEDKAIDPSKDYFYYIESISLGGVREVFSPIIKAPAKKPAEAQQD